MTAEQTDGSAQEDNERRKSKRYLVDDQPPITATSGGRLYTCRILDVSMDGVRLRFEGKIPPGKVLLLSRLENETDAFEQALQLPLGKL